MAVIINRLNAGVMTVGTGGGAGPEPEPSGHPYTRIKLNENDTWHEYDIQGQIGAGSIQNITMGQNPYDIEVGTNVTSLGDGFLADCPTLTGITIPFSVTSIGNGAFAGCPLTRVVVGSGVSSIGDSAFAGCTGQITFQGKTLAQVQAMENYPWGIEDTSIINVA